MSYNLKTKALSVMLILMVMLGVVAPMSYAAEKEAEIKLNRYVMFEGDAYWTYSGNRVRESYAEGEQGAGVISMILKNRVYIIGEGWVPRENILESSKFITLDINKDNLKDGMLTSLLTVKGEYTDIESANTGIIKYENGILYGVGYGETNVKINTKNGKTINVLANVTETGISLNIPEKSMNAYIDTNTTIADKVEIEADAAGNAILTIESGKLGIDVATNENANIKVDGKEVANYQGQENISASVSNKEGEGLKAEASFTGTQNLTLLEKLKLQAKEAAQASITQKQADASGNVIVSANDKEIAEVEAGITQEMNDSDAKVNAKVEILEKPVVETQRDVPIVKTIKSLLNKLISLF